MAGSDDARARFPGRCFALAAGLTLLHVLALPLAITYDGHEYIDFAAVLFSERFPADWQPPIRTPGYPFVLEVAFRILGRQPLAVVVVNAAFTLGSLAIVAWAARWIAGPVAAGLAVLVVAAFPLAVAYQHHALTESGTAFYLTLVTGLLLLPAPSARAGWGKAAALALAVAAGYYHRQSLQFVVPAVAVLLPLVACHPPGSRWWRGAAPPGGWLVLAAQLALALAVPHLLAGLWEPYVDSAGIRNYMVKQGIVRQALLPPDDPRLGDAREVYEGAIAEAWRADGLVSGLRFQRVSELEQPLYPRLGPAGPALVRLAWRHPARYAAGIGRTLLLYAGAPAAQRTNHAAEQAVFGVALASGRNHIDDGQPRLDASTRRAFSQPAAPGLVSRLLGALAPLYDRLLVPLALLGLPLVLVAGVVGRDVRLVTVALVPLAYVGGHALLLAAEDRYAFPVEPQALATLVAALVRGGAWLVDRRRAAASGGTGLA